MQIDRETIVKLAREAGIVFDDAAAPFYERFAKLLTEHEREACAKVCDDHATKDGFEGCYANACAESIRARGNT